MSESMSPRSRHISFVVSLMVTWMLTFAVHAAEIPTGLYGDWTLDIESGEAGWLRVIERNGELVVFMRVDVGLKDPMKDVKVEDGRLKFVLKQFRIHPHGKRTLTAGPELPVLSTDIVEVGLEQGKLAGMLTRIHGENERTEKFAFTGKRIPPMPAAPDLSKVRFGQPISLFNGRDLSGWRLRNPAKRNGWSVEDGVLVNTTPKTDFSATGDFGNLRTDEDFGDFWLHIEFLVEADRNSGVYLKGMYEAQVVDRYSRMQGDEGIGAIFWKIAPTKDAAKEPGEWQSYDITLVDRHITLLLNGVKVIDNQPIDGPTGGAMMTDPLAPGPIYLQGDHTSVKYRDIYLAPVVNQVD